MSPGSCPITLIKGVDRDVGVIGLQIARHLLKTSTLNLPRTWVWKTALAALPVWLAFVQLWRMNHGAHLGGAAAISLALTGTSAAIWALWHEYGRAAKLKGAQEAHSKFLAAAETSLDAFGLVESVRNDAGEIIDFRIVYVNANGERLVGRPRSELLGQLLCSVTPARPTSPMFTRFCKVVDSGEPLN